MTENASSNRPPLGLMGDLVVGDEGIDLKVRGTTPFVDAARILSLANKVNENNTVARLKSLSQNGKVREQEADAWCHAYLFLMLLRMRYHQQQAHDGKPLSNLLNPDSLDDLDRRILKESFRSPHRSRPGR